MKPLAFAPWLFAPWLFAIVACAPDVPTSPSFQQDVMPILAANCVRCHGVPAIGGAPETSRLDVFGDVTVRKPLLADNDPGCLTSIPDPGCFAVVIAGAATMAASSASRAGNDDRPMPPRFSLDDHQIELLEVWAANGAPRGEPRATNTRPTATVEAIERAGAVVRIRVHVTDVDRDLVGGSLHAQIAGNETFVGMLHDGVAAVTWDATGIAPGNYPLTARLDDGAALIVVPLGTITVEAP